MIRKRSKIGFIFASGLFFLLMLAVLELNQNSLLGLLLFLICSAGFWIVHRKFLRTRRFSAKGIAWLAWIGVFILILFVTWPPVRAVPAVEGDHPEKTRVIRISQGDLQGVVTSDGLVEVYAGILVVVGDKAGLRPLSKAHRNGSDLVLIFTAGKGAVTVNVVSGKKACTIKKLKQKTRYYVQVRPLKKSGEAVYTGSWTKKRVVRTK